jgi:hypothetical protein
LRGYLCIRSFLQEGPPKYRCVSDRESECFVLSVLAESLFPLIISVDIQSEATAASSLGGEPLLCQYLRQPRLPVMDRLLKLFEYRRPWVVAIPREMSRSMASICRASSSVYVCAISRAVWSLKRLLSPQLDGLLTPL